MTKEQKKIIIKFLLYIAIFLSILIVGISNVFADEIDIGYITSKTSVSYENTDAQAMVSLPVQTNVNRYLYNLLSINISNQNILADNIYVLELSTPNAKLQNINEVHIVDSSSNVCQFFGTSDLSIGYPKIYFKCNQATNSLTITLNNTNPSTLTYSITTSNNFQWNYSYLKYYTEDDDIDLGPIISNQTQNTQDIINNQNQNTQQQIESQKVCKNIDKTNILVDNSYISGTGSIVSNSSNYGYTDYINILQSTIDVTTEFSVSSSGSGLCFYNTNKSQISCLYNSNLSLGKITIPNNAEYVRFSINKNLNEPQFKICTNGNQALNDSVNNLNDTLNDDSTDGVDLNSLGNVSGWLPAGPIDSILLLPINFLTALNSSLSGTCSPLHINIPFIHTNVDIPCISTIFGQINGLTNFWNWVGRIVSIYILIKYFIGLYDYYDKLTTLQVNFIDDFGGGV